MKFTLFFFSSDAMTTRPYQLMLQAARFADRHRFDAVWTPERHFDRFGGAFANPAITSAALAVATTRLELRAGSLISPLHDVLRVAEEWAMVDQLSGGRVALSFGSGWNARDFVYFPERFARRQAIVYDQIETVRRLWRGETIERSTPTGVSTIEVFPKPMRSEIPIWLTTSGSVETYRSAGHIGANVLTHMIMQGRRQLAERIAIYRQERRAAGLVAGEGVVSLMLHTFLGSSDAVVRDLVRPSFREYLRSAVNLEVSAAQVAGTVSGGLRMCDEAIPADLVEELLDMTFERYYEQASCMGTVDKVQAFLRELAAIGVDEIACLIDFGVPESLVLESLGRLAALSERFADP